MARMPGAVWQGEHGSRLMDRYDIVCIHTIVGYAPAHAAHFSVKADGTIIQSRDTRYRSAANLDGNHRVIAIENEDHGPAFGGTPRDTTKWPALTDEQVASNAEILAWAHATHGIPLQLCPDSLPSSRGLAYHRQGIDGNFGEGTAYPAPGRVAGGEVWTESRGKVCPGDARINQRPAVLAAAIDIVGGDDMAKYEETLDAIAAGVKQMNKQLRDYRTNSWRRDVELRKVVVGLVADVQKGNAQDKAGQAAIVDRLQRLAEALDTDEP